LGSALGRLGVLTPDMIIDEFENYPVGIRNILVKHPDFGRRKIEITKKTPHFEFEVIR